MVGVWYDKPMEKFEAPRFENPGEDVDLRHESEVFQDHERMDGDDEKAAAIVKSEKDKLAEETDGIIYISIPEYDYDISHNPFLGMGPNTVRIYSISRHLDVTFLHKFMYGNILVSAIQSGKYVPPHKRAKFVEHLKKTGGLPLGAGEKRGYDFTALRFAPYVGSDSTMPMFELYHKSDAYAGERPHYPLDVWAVYDLVAYDEVGGGRYRLKPGYDRQSSLLAAAVIN